MGKFPVLFLGWYFYNIEDIFDLEISSFFTFCDVLNEKVFCVGKQIFYNEKIENIKLIESEIKEKYKIESEPTLTVVFDTI
jgi:hypothetical protein